MRRDYFRESEGFILAGKPLSHKVMIKLFLKRACKKSFNHYFTALARKKMLCPIGTVGNRNDSWLTLS